MPKSSKPRKQYRPKKVLLDPVGYTLDGLRHLEKDYQVKLGLRARTAYQALVPGSGTLNNWNSVRAALNITSVVCELYLGEEHIEDLREALRAHAECGERFISKGRFGYTGPDMERIKLALDIHEVQLESLTTEQMEKTYAETLKRIRAGQAEFTLSHAKMFEREKSLTN